MTARRARRPRSAPPRPGTHSRETAAQKWTRAAARDDHVRSVLKKSRASRGTAGAALHFATNRNHSTEFVRQGSGRSFGLRAPKSVAACAHEFSRLHSSTQARGVVRRYARCPSRMQRVDCSYHVERRVRAARVPHEPASARPHSEPDQRGHGRSERHGQRRGAAVAHRRLASRRHRRGRRRRSLGTNLTAACRVRVLARESLGSGAHPVTHLTTPPPWRRGAVGVDEALVTSRHGCGVRLAWPRR